jgi:hypothetical protein
MRGAAQGASTTLVTAQWATTRVPYLAMLFTAGTSTVDFSTDSGTYGDRILGIDHREEAYNDYAYIILEDHDRIVPDLTGYWTEIGYGLTTSGGKEHAHTARLWVKHQQYIWLRNHYTVLLELEGMWARMGELPIDVKCDKSAGDPPLFYDSSTTRTPWALLDNFVEGQTAADIIPFVITLDEDDGIINANNINFEVNSNPNDQEYLIQVVKALMNMTQSYLVLKPANSISVVYPAGTTTPDVIYYRDATPQYTSFVERQSLIIPNQAHVYTVADTAIVGEYSDTAQIAKYENTMVYAYDSLGSLDSEAKADTRAEAIIKRGDIQATNGRIVVRHDCRVELYDRISVVTSG